jgi:hypothetical protein
MRELDELMIREILNDNPEEYSGFYVPSQCFEDAMDLVKVVKKMGFSVFLQFTHQDNLNVCYISKGYAAPYRPDEEIENIHTSDILARSQHKSMAMAICLACKDLIPHLGWSK